MQKIINKIFSQSVFEDRPPILIDVGASGSVHARFKPLAKASVCIAFDADDREMHQVVAKDSKDFKRLYVVNSVLSEKEDTEIPFFLTKYPYCSSTLKPDSDSLKDWDRSEIFEIEKLSSIKATTLRKVLTELNLSKVDWFKTDSQGTDLRLFQSLGEDLIKKVLVAEFEPGFINSYVGEDKIHGVLSYMEKFNFWISDIKMRGFRRIKPDLKNKLFNKLEKVFFSKCLKQSPGWAEITYVNSLSGSQLFEERDFFLSWTFATVLGQHGHALDVALRADELFENGLFAEMASFSTRRMKIPIYLLPYYAIKKKLSRRYRE
jgi:FkbM family methyltransferase